MGLLTLLQNQKLSERYNKLKRYFFIKESAYDLTSRCQLRCEGCYYFKGEKYQVSDNKNIESWKEFMSNEKVRGINYVNLAGAEPALVPKILETCYRVIPFGTIFTNGLKRIDPQIKYRIQISIWGNKEGDPIYRKYANGKPGPFCLPIQLENYGYDDRAIFVYTFNSENIDQVDDVINAVANYGRKITFNVFSIPQETNSNLFVKNVLIKIRNKMIYCLEKYPNTVIFSYYNAFVHTNSKSLRNQFGCPYPRASNRNFGVSNSFRSYRSDFTHVKDDDCCIPDTDCNDCRHYAAGSAIVTSKVDLHIKSEHLFRGWLDYVDTYLAIWLNDYNRDTEYLFKKSDYDTLANSF